MSTALSMRTSETMEMNNLNAILDQVSKDKGVAKNILVEALEAAMLTAARKVHGLDRDIEAHFNEDSRQGLMLPRSADCLLAISSQHRGWKGISKSFIILAVADYTTT